MANTEWKEVKLREVANYVNEKVETKLLTIRNYISTENLLPNIGGITESSKLPTVKKVNGFKEKDILFSNIRTYFKKIWLSDTFGGASNDVLIIRSSNSEIVANEYLYYSLAQDEFFDYTVQTSKGTKMPRGDKEAIMNYTIRFPVDIEKQKEIANTFITLDDKIELNNQMNQTLEEITQNLFKEWFVEFNFPNEDGVPYKDNGGEMEESELGEIPKGWRVEEASKAFNINIGKTPPRKEKEWFSFDNNDIKWLSIKDMGKAGTFILNTSEYLTQEAIEKHNVKIVPKDTVVLSFKLTVGRLGITNVNMVTNEAIAHFNIKDNEEMTKEYIYSYLKTFNYESLGSTSSIAKAVNSKVIKSMPIILPDNKTMTIFTEKVANIFEMIRKKQEETNSMIETRDTLLPKLMSGEVRV